MKSKPLFQDIYCIFMSLGEAVQLAFLVVLLKGFFYII